MKYIIVDYLDQVIYQELDGSPTYFDTWRQASDWIGFDSNEDDDEEYDYIIKEVSR